MIVRDGDLADEHVQALLAEHLAGMHASSPPGSVHALQPGALQGPDIAVYTVWDGGDLMAIGALKEVAPEWGEVKSMRTARAFLRRGAAAILLDHLITMARARGYVRLSLETGSGPAFEPAVALYLRRGFTPGEPFGAYEPSAFNRFFHLHLS